MSLGSAGATRTLTSASADPAAFVTVTVYVASGVSAAGVPLMSPVSASSWSPVGSAGATENVPIPPVTVGRLGAIVSVAR